MLPLHTRLNKEFADCSLDLGETPFAAVKPYTSDAKLSKSYELSVGLRQNHVFVCVCDTEQEPLCRSCFSDEHIVTSR